MNTIGPIFLDYTPESERGKTLTISPEIDSQFVITEKMVELVKHEKKLESDENVFMSENDVESDIKQHAKQNQNDS